MRRNRIRILGAVSIAPLPFDVNLLTVLALLPRTRSVTRTAQTLGVSQPSVSRSLSQLRALLEDPLLVRVSGGMGLTRRAEELSEPLQRWLEDTASLLDPPRFDPRALERRFRVASTDFGVAAVVSPALAHLVAEAPGVSIDIAPFTADMMQKLASGEIDLIISGLDPDRSQAYDRYLFTEDFVCVVGPDHPLVGKVAPDRAMPLDDYLASPHISIVINDAEFDRIGSRLGDRAPERRIIARLPYFQAAPTLIPATQAIMTLPRRAADELARAYSLSLLPAPDRIGTFDYRLLWHERGRRDPATHWLCDRLAAHCTAPPPHHALAA